LKRKPKVVSLFSGGGGLDLGFEQAGYTIVYSTDNWSIASETLNNRKKLKRQKKIIELNDICEVDFKKIKNRNKRIDVVIGGPPCPPFSKSRFYLENKPRGIDDPDGLHTLTHYLRAIKELNPQTFLFENVAGFNFKPHQKALIFLKNKATKLGYQIETSVLNCADYGVPQIRERFFCIGIKDNTFKFPLPTHTNISKINSTHGIQMEIKETSLKPRITCKEAIGDLDYPLLEDKDNQAGSKHQHLLKKIPPGDNYLFFTKERGHPNPEFKYRSRYWSFLLKLSPDLPSWTIQASFSNNQGPFHWNNRYLRIQEIKRLQTFPDDYEFSGDFKDQWRQIGNAVPPLMANILANEIKKYL
jgi:DNA (cytosine-5)-methyltransferase 1